MTQRNTHERGSSCSSHTVPRLWDSYVICVKGTIKNPPSAGLPPFPGMVSVIISDGVTSKSFLYPHKETMSSLRSWSVCLLPIGSQIHSHPSPVLLCITQSNCLEAHFLSSFVSRFVGPEISAVWGLSYIKIV